MVRISYGRRRFPPTVIPHVVLLYTRFTLSLRYAEEMLAQRGVDASDATIRAWTVKSGPTIAADLRRRELPPSSRWRLEEMVRKIAGEQVLLWRTVDNGGEVLDFVVQRRRDRLRSAISDDARGDVQRALW